MAKLSNRIRTKQDPLEGAALDTLAQLSTTTPKEGKSKPKDKANFQKRAKAKSLTDVLIFKLVDVKDSPLNKAYWNTFHCSRVVLQDGTEVKSTYCKNRWCLVCNRIRTGEAINGYLKPLTELEDKYFVTLTIRSVKAEDLRDKINEMSPALQRIRKNLAKSYGMKLQGIRKLECNYNPKTKTFNPHFHLLIKGKDVSQQVRSLWLSQFPEETSNEAQDIRPANNDTFPELFKYFTKVVTKGKIYPEAMDTIFRAMRNKRVIQPMGIKKNKEVTEELEDLICKNITFKDAQSEIWKWEHESFDWVNGSGECFSEYEPTKEEVEYLERLKR